MLSHVYWYLVENSFLQSAQIINGLEVVPAIIIVCYGGLLLNVSILPGTARKQYSHKCYFLQPCRACCCGTITIHLPRRFTKRPSKGAPHVRKLLPHQSAKQTFSFADNLLPFDRLQIAHTQQHITSYAIVLHIV
jgi:hypothetical protein